MMDRTGFPSILNPSGCQRWRGDIDATGFGIVVIDSYLMWVHDLAWVLHTGVAIPPGQHVVQICDDHACITPAHLALVEAVDEDDDGVHARAERAADEAEEQTICDARVALYEKTNGPIPEGYTLQNSYHHSGRPCLEPAHGNIVRIEPTRKETMR
jgi:hypothetical protein